MAMELKDRLEALRERLRALGVQGMVVPHEDEYQNEFIPAHSERLAWLTGFTGSAGAAVVLMDKAAVFVDGRYALQVTQQVDTGVWETHNIADQHAYEWAVENTEVGQVIVYDPWLHTPSFREVWRQHLALSGAELRPLVDNPINHLWADRPVPDGGPAVPHPIQYAGQESRDKRKAVGEIVHANGVRAALITALDSVAWLFNIRGSDGPYTPVVEARALLMDDGTASLYLDDAKATPELFEHLGADVSVRSPDLLLKDLRMVAANHYVLADPLSVPLALVEAIEGVGGRIFPVDDPCQLPKALKNPVEVDGMRQAHRRDGVALVRFLAWLDAQMQANGTDEMTAVAELYRFRSEGDLFKGVSFDTISGAGPNGAIIHYRVTEESNRPLKPGELFLLDSGGQYLDGTTDVTRTVALGDVSTEERDRFTRVLKGHIAIGQARFPVGTTGGHLDSLARKALWDAGLDYDHGTGHGVGSYLNVHEGPQRISRRGGDVALQPGMVISNEPGFYKNGAYGIRIESLVAVKAGPEGEAGRKFLSFETLTLAPIDRRLIDADSLSPDERQWVDDYHARVRAEIGPDLDDVARGWLEAATAPL